MIPHFVTEFVKSSPQRRRQCVPGSPRLHLVKSTHPLAKTERGPPFVTVKKRQVTCARPKSQRRHVVTNTSSSSMQFPIASSTMAPFNHELQTDATRSAANSYSLANRRPDDITHLLQRTKTDSVAFAVLKRGNKAKRTHASLGKHYLAALLLCSL